MWTTYSTTFKPSPEERQAKQDDGTTKDVMNLVKYMNVGKIDPNDPVVPEENLLLDVGVGNWTTYSTNFKPTTKERQAKQDDGTAKDVMNLVKYMNVGKTDPIDPVVPKETTSFLDLGNWTTYSTSFKPSQEERQAKQDASTTKDVMNLVKYMNVGNVDPNDPVAPEENDTEGSEGSEGSEVATEEEEMFVDLGIGNSTTYSTNFKPTQEERQAKQDATTKNHVSNLIKLMNQKPEK